MSLISSIKLIIYSIIFHLSLSQSIIPIPALYRYQSCQDILYINSSVYVLCRQYYSNAYDIITLTINETYVSEQPKYLTSFGNENDVMSADCLLVDQSRRLIVVGSTFGSFGITSKGQNAVHKGPLSEGNIFVYNVASYVNTLSNPLGSKQYIVQDCFWNGQSIDILTNYRPLQNGTQGSFIYKQDMSSNDDPINSTTFNQDVRLYDMVLIDDVICACGNYNLSSATIQCFQKDSLQLINNITIYADQNEVNKTSFVQFTSIQYDSLNDLLYVIGSVIGNVTSLNIQSDLASKTVVVKLQRQTMQIVKANIVSQAQYEEAAICSHFEQSTNTLFIAGIYAQSYGQSFYLNAFYRQIDTNNFGMIQDVRFGNQESAQVIGMKVVLGEIVIIAGQTYTAGFLTAFKNGIQLIKLDQQNADPPNSSSFLSPIMVILNLVFVLSVMAYIKMVVIPRSTLGYRLRRRFRQQQQNRDINLEDTQHDQSQATQPSPRQSVQLEEQLPPYQPNPQIGNIDTYLDSQPPPEYQSDQVPLNITQNQTQQ